ncbi:hypothetical protein SVIOM342S_10631 [Streptomyces violaceorubidus]
MKNAGKRTPTSQEGLFHVKPIDPRLLRYARATRIFLAAVVALGAVGAGLLVAQAMLVAEVVVGAFQHGTTAAGLRTPLLLLAASSPAAGRWSAGSPNWPRTGRARR